MKISLLKSDEIVGNSIKSAKSPDSKSLSIGELAINYADGYETLFFLNSSNNVVSIKVNDVEETKNSLANHIADLENPHKVTKSQIGLGNVDNTADVDKPLSTLQQTEFDKKLDKDGGIVDNLMTNSSTQALSAQQGVELKKLIEKMSSGTSTDLSGLLARIQAVEEEVEKVVEKEQEIMDREDYIINEANYQ